MDKKVDRLDHLARLLKAGEITEAEHELLRERLLSELTSASITIPGFKTPAIPDKAQPSRRSSWLIGVVATTFVIGFLAGRFTLSPPGIPSRITQTEHPDDMLHDSHPEAILPEAREKHSDDVLREARAKFAHGDYRGSRDLCEKLFQQDGKNYDAEKCAIHANQLIRKIAKEAYVHGYILESMGRGPEAEEYFKKAAKDLEPSDPLYGKVMTKLPARAPSSFGQ